MLAITAASALLALAVAVVDVAVVLRAGQGSARMRAIAGAIRTGAMVFLRREYAVVAAVAAVIAAALVAALGTAPAIGFVLGAAGSALAGALGVVVSVRANVRTAAIAASGDRARTTRLAFRASSAIGLGVVGLATLALAGCRALFGGDVAGMAGLLVGASLVSLFARVGGGIFTKGADVGADLVGKLELGIPEDDPRNPAVIADNVGDNVGDCAGMAADLFETFLVTGVAALLLGQLIGHARAAFPGAELYPAAICACGIVASVVGGLVVRTRTSIEGALYGGLAVTLALAAAGLYALDRWLMRGDGGVLAATLVGLGVVAVVVASTHYYTSARHHPVARVTRAADAGAGPVVIAGLSVGLGSVWLPGLAVVAGTLAAFFALARTAGGLDPELGLYGIGLAATSMVAVMGAIVSIDAFGPIADNAGGIVEMAGAGADARAVTDALDAAGNTTKAITKGYAIGSAALAALSLFAAYTFAAAQRLGVAWPAFTHTLTLDDPLIVTGLLVGALVPFVFASLLMTAVGVAARAIVDEVRRQFADIVGLAEGRADPDSGRCIAIVTATALRQLIAPGAIAVLVPVVVWFALGPRALAGVLLGVVLSGFPLAIVMTTSGAAWDNAKKELERRRLGRSPAHDAAVVGDIVGDATKDAAGPAINPLIKVVNTVALLCLALLQG